MANYPKIGLIAFLNTAAFTAGLKTYTAGLATLTTQTLGANRTLNAGFLAMGSGVLDMAKKAAQATAIIGMAATGVAVKFTYDAAKASMEAESAFAGVVKTAGNLTVSYGELNAEGRALKQTLLDMSTIKPLSFVDLSAIAQVGAQAGLPSRILAPFTDMMADLVSATDMDPSNASMRIAQFINIMGVLGEGAGDPIENIKSLGATIADLGNKFPTTELETIVLAQRIAGMGAAVGMATQDVLALAAAMTAVGVRSEAGGTAAQRVLMAMQEAVSGAAGKSTIDNTAQIAKAQKQILALEENIAIKRQQIAEQTERTAESTRMTRERDLKNLEDRLEDEKAKLDSFQASHGKSAQQMQGQLAKFAKLAGVSANEFAAIFREDPGEAMRLFVLGLAKEGNNAAQVLKSLGLSDARLVRSFLQLAGAGDLITDAMIAAQTAWDEQIALIDEAQERYATLESIFDILKNRFKAVQIQVGDTLRPAIKEIIKLFGMLEAPGKRLVSLFQKRIGPALTYVATAFRMAAMGDRKGMFAGFRAALVVAFGADTTMMIEGFMRKIQGVFSSISEWVTNNRQLIEGAIKGISTLLITSGIVAMILKIAGALSALTSPIGLLVLAVGALGAAWETNWLGIQDTVLEVTDKIIPKLTALWEQLTLWFAEELTPKINEGDWIGAGETIIHKIWEGLSTAISKIMPLDLLLRQWMGEQLNLIDKQELPAIPITIVGGGVVPDVPTWTEVGTEIWQRINQGISNAIKKVPSLNQLLLDQVSKALKIQPGQHLKPFHDQLLDPLGLNDIYDESGFGSSIDDSLSPIAVSWFDVGAEISSQLAQGASGFGGTLASLLLEAARPGGALFEAAGQLGRIIGNLIVFGLGMSWSDPNNRELQAEAAERFWTGLVPAFFRLGYEFGKSLIFSIVAGISGIPYDTVVEAMDYWTDTIKGWFRKTPKVEEEIKPEAQKMSRFFAEYLYEYGLAPEELARYRWLPPEDRAIDTLFDNSKQRTAAIAARDEARSLIYGDMEREEALQKLMDGTFETEQRRSELAELGATTAAVEQETRSQVTDQYIELIAHQSNAAQELASTLELSVYGHVEALTTSAEVARKFVEESLGQWHAAIVAMRISAETMQRYMQSEVFGRPSDVPEGAYSGYAHGTNFFRGGLALVGEKGPELVSLPRGSKIFSNESLMGRYSMPASVVNNSSYNITVEVPAGTPFETRQAASIGVLEALRAVGVA